MLYTPYKDGVMTQITTELTESRWLAADLGSQFIHVVDIIHQCQLFGARRQRALALFTIFLNIMSHFTRSWQFYFALKHKRIAAVLMKSIGILSN